MQTKTVYNTFRASVDFGEYLAYLALSTGKSTSNLMEMVSSMPGDPDLQGWQSGEDRRRSETDDLDLLIRDIGSRSHCERYMNLDRFR